MHEEDLGSPRSISTLFHVLCHVTLFVSHDSTTGDGVGVHKTKTFKDI